MAHYAGIVHLVVASETVDFTGSREVKARRRAAELGISPDEVPKEDVELGLFAFWEEDDLRTGATAAVDNPFLQGGKPGSQKWRHSAEISEAAERTLRCALPELAA